MSSSLNTLLEAARFLELQEQEQQHRATVEAALAASMGPSSPSPSSSSVTSQGSSPERGSVVLSSATMKTVTANHSPPQTVVISSGSILPSSVLHSPVNVAKKTVDQDGHVSSTTMHHQQPQVSRHRLLNNSFDIMNPVMIDEVNGGSNSKRKQPPMVFRAGTREVHNKLEKHRRAHLKECFDILKKQLPSAQDEKKTSNLSILHSALRYIQLLKRKERELEHEMERLAREKINAQQRLAVLRKEISSHYDNVDFSKLLPDVVTNANSNATTETTVEQTMTPRTETVVVTSNTVSSSSSQNGASEKVIPILAKAPPNVPQSIKEQQPQAATALSVLPMTYPVNQGLVLQKLIVPKGLDGLTPLVSTHFIAAAPQQINGKVVPLTQYVVKPVVVVSTASPRPS